MKLGYNPWLAFVVGPRVAITILLWPMPGVPDAAHRLAAVFVLMIVLWMTEAIPLAVTALLGPTLVVLLGVAPARTAFAPFADPIIFLFIGSFILAEPVFVHRLDRRMAYSALASPWIGSSAWRLVLVYAGVSAGLSMWMSNTATTAMFFPLGMAVLAELGRGRTNDPAFRRFALTMMLVTSFAASIGVMATPVGTPPNLIGKGLLLKNAGIYISFAGWMAFGFPLVLIVYFRIYRNGSTSDVEVRQTSEIPSLDLSAKRAIQNAQPFPPLPDDCNKDYLGIILIFEHSK